MLNLKTTPRLARGDLVMTSPKQKQIGQHRDTHRVRAALLVAADLMLAQSQARFEFPIDELNRPTLLVNAHHLSRGQLRQIGHQDFGVLRAHVTPFFTQYHGDVTDMTQTQALAINPKGFATLTLDVFGNPGSSVQGEHSVILTLLVTVLDNVQTPDPRHYYTWHNVGLTSDCSCSYTTKPPSA